MYLSKFINFEKSNLIVVARTVSEEIGSEPIISELNKGVKIAYFYFLDIKEKNSIRKDEFKIYEECVKCNNEMNWLDTGEAFVKGFTMGFQFFIDTFNK